MAITRKQHYRGSDFNNKDLKDAKSLQLNQDAANADEAVRLSQSESIADQAAQDILVENGFSASNTTAFTSASLVSFLAAKQDNLSIHSSSTAFAEFVNGTELKIKRLVTLVKLEDQKREQTVRLETLSAPEAQWRIYVFSKLYDII